MFILASHIRKTIRMARPPGVFPSGGGNLLVKKRKTVGPCATKRNLRLITPFLFFFTNDANCTATNYSSSVSLLSPSYYYFPSPFFPLETPPQNQRRSMFLNPKKARICDVYKELKPGFIILAVVPIFLFFFFNVF